VLKLLDTPRYHVPIGREQERSAYDLGFRLGTLERQAAGLFLDGRTRPPRSFAEAYEDVCNQCPEPDPSPYWEETHAAILRRGFEAGAAAWDVHLLIMQERWGRDPRGLPCPDCGNREYRLMPSHDPAELGRAVCGGCGRRYVGHADPDPIVGPEAHPNSPIHDMLANPSAYFPKPAAD
jgi:hypothetical protein